MKSTKLSICRKHCVKYSNLAYFPGVETVLSHKISTPGNYRNYHNLVRTKK